MPKLFLVALRLLGEPRAARDGAVGPEAEFREGEGGHDRSGPPVQCDVTRRERNTLCWVESSSTSSRGSFKQSGQYEGIQVQRPGEQRQGGQSMQVWG